MLRLKRGIAVLTLLGVVLCSCMVWAAEPTDFMSSDVIIPTLGKIETRIEGDDFEGAAIRPYWAGVTRMAQEDGNQIGKVNSNTTGSFGLGKMWLSDFTVRLNFSVEYVDNSWVEVVNVKHRDDNSKAKIMLHRSADHKSSRLILETKGQTPNLWKTYDIPSNHSVYDGAWQYIKVTVKGDAISVYFNDEDVPVIEATGLTIPNAAVAFKPFASTLYVDNLLISKAKNLPAVTVKPDTAGKTVLAEQTFEAEPVADTGFVGGQAATEEGENCYKLGAKVTTGAILGNNYDVEFNMLGEYTGVQEAVFMVDADQNGNGYGFAVGNDAYNKETFRFFKRVDGLDESHTVTVEKGNGLTNWAEANDIWAYFKIEKRNNVLKLYFNHKETPSYILTDPAPLGGGSFSIDPGTTTSCCLDNLTVTVDALEKRMKIQSVTEQEVIAQSSYAAPVEGEAIVLYYQEDVLTGMERAALQFPAAVLDGRDFATATYVHDAEAYKADRVEAYMVDSKATQASTATMDAKCEDVNLQINGSISGLQGQELLLLISQAESEKVILAQKFKAENDGGFTYQHTFTTKDTEGDYIATLYDGKATLALEKSFQYISDDNLAIFLGNLDTVRKDQTLFATMMSSANGKLYLRRLGVMEERFEAMGMADAEKIRTILNENVAEETLTEVNTGTFMNDAIFGAMVQEAEDAKAVQRLYEGFADCVVLDADIKKEFEDRADKITSEVYEGVYQQRNTCTSFATGTELLTEQIILADIYKSSYMDVYSLLKKHETALKIELSELPDSETKRNQMMQKLNAKRCYMYQDFADLYKDTVGTRQNNGGSTGGTVGRPSSSRPSGSGGGGGGVPSAGTPVQGDQTVLYEAEKELTERISYEDVAPEYWGYSYICKLSDLGVIRGYEDERFYPERQITRAELCKMLCEAFALPAAVGESGFEDVTEKDWHYIYVTAAKEAGLVKGVGEQRFEPDASISRQDIAVILHRLADRRGIQLDAEEENQIVYADQAEIAAYAQLAVEEMSVAGILKGDGECFAPERGATRAEASKIVCCVLEMERGAIE